MDTTDARLPALIDDLRALPAETVARPLFPPVAVRELTADGLVHQDMTITGAGSTVELFRDRIEITSPGAPLVAPERLIDYPLRSRNEALASLMRRMGLCEEQGAGIDKVVNAVEEAQLPPSEFRAGADATRVIPFGLRHFADMTAEERLVPAASTPCCANRTKAVS